MPGSIHSLILFAGLALASPVIADVAEATMPAGITYGYGSDAGRSMQGVLELAPRIDVRLAPAATLVASGRVRLDLEDELEPGRPQFASYAPLTRPAALGETGTAELRDFYVEFRNRNGIVRLGKQQVVWGRLDGIKVLDLVDPQSFREFILDDFGRSRIGLWSVYVDQGIGDWRAELVAVPDATGHAIPEAGAWFELTAPRFRFGAAVNDPALAVVTSPPGHGLDEAAWGLRLSRRVGRLDLSAVAYSGIDHEPLGRLAERNQQTVVERFHERREAYGLSAETGFGRFVLRAEYAFQPERVFNTRDATGLGTVALDQHRGAIGLDVSAPLDIFINVQYLVDTIPDAVAGLVRPERDEVATAFVRRSFGYDRFDVELRWYHSVMDSDNLRTLAVRYAATANTTLRLAAESFSGEPYGLFGQFDARDRVTFSIEHTF